MIKVKVFLNRDGSLKGFKARGHADVAPSGTDILCAGVTVLLRTTGKVLINREGIEVSFRGDKPGQLDLVVHCCSPDLSFWLLGVGDTLIQGLKDLVAEYPKNLKIQII